jgi:hypothetical protein
MRPICPKLGPFAGPAESHFLSNPFLVKLLHDLKIFGPILAHEVWISDIMWAFVFISKTNHLRIHERPGHGR